MLRDLFRPDDGGWLQDPMLLDRLVGEKLQREADAVRAEGWKWVEIATDLPYGHTYGLRRLTGEQAALTEEETATREALRAEYQGLEESYAQADELPEEVDRRLAEIEAALATLEDRPLVYDPAEVARAGAFVSIDGVGGLRIERGFVQPEDEAPVASADGDAAEGDKASVGTTPVPTGAATTAPQPNAGPTAEPAEEDEGLRPLSDRLLTELTAHRTLALRDALANDPDVAFLAALHVLCLKMFYRYGLDSCLEIEPECTLFGAQAPALGDTVSAKAIDARHAAWAAQLPKEPEQLWNVLASFDGDSRQGLFAHCVALTVNATYEAYDRRPKALAHADRVAAAVGLDMAAVGWRPTVESYLGRVTKGRILDAVREASGGAAAERIAHLKKAEMATAAEQLLADTGWLPGPLRTPGQSFVPCDDMATGSVSEANEPVVNGGDAAVPEADRDSEASEPSAAPPAIAAE